MTRLVDPGGCIRAGLAPFLAGLFIFACAQPGVSTGPGTDSRESLLRAIERDPQPAPAPESVRVRLVFGSDVDLDLHVTGPRGETVSFARPNTAAGGSFATDVRCETLGPRIERVTFPTPPSGRYTVGVDFPRRCDEEYASAHFLIVVEHGSRRIERHGEIAPAHFRSDVLEFVVDEAGP